MSASRPISSIASDAWILGAVLLVAALALPFGSAPLLVALLTAGLFGIAVTLGAGIVIAACVLTGARWWLPLRGPLSAMVRLCPAPLLMLAAVLVLGREQLYPWAREAAVAADPLLQEKTAWLSEPFFLLRGFVVLLAWWALSRWLAAALDRWGSRPDEDARRGLVRASVAFVLLLGPTLSIAAWDWAMSLEPVWFSTMYSVYLFSGFFLAGLAALAALVTARASLPGVEPVDIGVRHDLGKLVFAFSSFWAYIWYCQYMLIWYANLPEEVTYFVLRLTPRWSTAFWLVLVLSFVVPFLVLMPARAKKHPATLFQVCLVVLAGRCLDLYVMVAPPVGTGRVAIVMTAGLTLVLVSGLVIGVRRSLEREQSKAARPAESRPAAFPAG